ncbi:hypothetical protein CLG96_14710 [Sphingomonas oleivorans]|uniref:Uncharacterized protein n=1 Tax=Sphingomonas oleivorans TaxID=1735121 RepID=A0A2T5FVG9_9SPHN|nr:hypothetical protein [Sphingomonas oleivorans]PTQ09437.1 hypothetical protein CLG96_14710 [Sphingomonas oleivorans]
MSLEAFGHQIGADEALVIARLARCATPGVETGNVTEQVRRRRAREDLKLLRVDRADREGRVELSRVFGNAGNGDLGDVKRRNEHAAACFQGHTFSSPGAIALFFAISVASD